MSSINSVWAVSFEDGYGQSYMFSKHNLDTLIERKSDTESYEITDQEFSKTIKKFGNRISYAVKIFDNNSVPFSDSDIELLNTMDGNVVRFYEDIIKRPHNYKECYFYFYYDDCDRAPLHFFKLMLKRVRLEKLSATISARNIITTSGENGAG